MTNYPWVCIIIFLILMGLCIPGIMDMTIVEDKNDIMVIPNSELTHQTGCFNDNFGAFMRSEVVIFKPKDEE